jgi:hypothetical protein
MFLKPTSSWSFTLPHFAHRKRNEKKEKNLSGPYLVFQKKQNSVAQKDPSYASHPNRESLTGRRVSWQGQRQAKRKEKATKTPEIHRGCAASR